MDQDNCTIPTNKAILLERTFRNKFVQLWIVKHLKTHKINQQVFYNKKLLMYLNKNRRLQK